MAPLKVLFVCIGNSCRSPMAESMANALGGGRVSAQSAGLAPAGFVAEPTLTTLDRLGYPSLGLYSKAVDAIDTSDLDVVVSLLGQSHTHIVPGTSHLRVEHWAVPDPFGEDETTYLRVAREIEARVRQFLEAELSGELLSD